MDLGLDIADDLAKVDFKNNFFPISFDAQKHFQLKKDMDKLKKSGMDMDMNIEQMDWVEDNKKVRPPVFKFSSMFFKVQVFKLYLMFESCFSKLNAFQVKAFFIYESSV